MFLEKNQELYMQTIQFLDESMEDYLYLYHFGSNRLYLTRRICEKFDIESGEDGIPLHTWIQLIAVKDRGRFEQNIRDIRNGVRGYHEIEYRLRDRQGNKVWVYCRGKLVKDTTGESVFLIGSISELEKKYRTDGLTGLWTFEKFMKDLDKCVHENRGCLMIFGFDDFKSINMKNGRKRGDDLLRRAGEFLEEQRDPFLRPYRLEGDCFAINFIGKTQKEAYGFYMKLKQRLEPGSSISAGVVGYQMDEGENGGMIYQYAVNAMERAKKEGKSRLVVFNFEDYQKQLDQLKFQEELALSVKQGCSGFYLCYQPQIDNRNFHLYGAEALLRYQSPSRGLVSPVEFIPILEKTGLICEVGEWVLKTALKQCAKWRETLPDFHMNVNLSYRQLQQNDIVNRVLNVLYETEVPGDALTLELTESIQLQDYGFYNKIFSEWKKYGIKIAIDDFGTGYSSLAYLRNLDVDETKIDRSFVNRIQSDSYNFLLLSNMIDLAHRTQIQVCCEGVETEEELMALQELNPDILQGFLFAKPYRPEEFEEYYMKNGSTKYREREEKEESLRRKKIQEDKTSLEGRRKDEVLNIVDGLEEVIYVADNDTHEIYYMNAAGQRMTGAYHYEGCKCYSVLQGRDAPCENCNLKKLRADAFYTWEMKNTFLNRHFVVKDKIIQWHGKEARLEIAIDVSNLKGSTLEEKEWLYVASGKRDNTLSWDFSRLLLNHIDLGMWVIRLDERNGKHEMYTDQVMNRILGLQEAMDPEACYIYWNQRINPDDAAYVNQAVQKTASGAGICQVQYAWNHPELGEVPVRCVGVRAKDRGGMICIEGYHRLLSNVEALPSDLTSAPEAATSQNKSVSPQKEPVPYPG